MSTEPLQNGQYIGNYRVVRQIGAGGMGAVFEAIHEEIGRRVAIKVLHPNISGNPEIARRFINEARAVIRIQHPGLVQVFDFGRLPDNSAYIVMEFLEGETLAERLRRAGGRLPEQEVLRLSRQLAVALSVTHDKAIIHRDLKPDNIMLVSDPELPQGERAKIFDFGIAKLDQPGSADKTRTNAIIGTATYMAPEQCRGSGAITDRTDVYTLGIILYQMLAGRPPFVAEEDVEIMTMHIRTPAPDLRGVEPQVSAKLDALIGSMLSKGPSDRPSMRQVAQTLGQMLPQSISGLMPVYVPPAPPEGWIRRHSQMMTAGAVGILLTGGILALLMSRSAPNEPRATAPTRLLAPDLAPTVNLSAGSASAAAPPALPRQVRWRITTEPPGAQIVIESSKEVLGTTPWEGARPYSNTKVNLVLKKPEYFRKKIELDQSRDEERTEKLTAIDGNSVEALPL